MADKKLAMKLRRLMEEQGLSPSQLARKMYGEVVEKRVDRHGQEYLTTAANRRSAVHKWLKGERRPETANLMELAKALRVPLAELDPEAGGLRIGDVDGEGMVDVQMDLRVPAHVAKTIRTLVEGYLR